MEEVDEKEWEEEKSVVCKGKTTYFKKAEIQIKLHCFLPQDLKNKYIRK